MRYPALIESAAALVLALSTLPPGAAAREPIAHPRFASGDLDGDGRQEVVVGGRVGPFRALTDPAATGRARIDVYSQEGRLLSPIAGNDRLHVVNDVATADLDADGRDEVLAVGTGLLSVFGLGGDGLSLLRQISLDAGWTHRIDAADLDGDGRPEIAIAGYRIGPDAGRGSTTISIHRWTGAGLDHWGQVEIPLHVGDFVLGDLDDSGGPDLVLETGAGDEGGEAALFRLFGNRFIEAWRGPVTEGAARSLHLSALPGSRIIAFGLPGGTVACFEVAGGALQPYLTERLNSPLSGLLLTRGSTGPSLVTARGPASGLAPRVVVEPFDR